MSSRTALRTARAFDAWNRLGGWYVTPAEPPERPEPDGMTAGVEADEMVRVLRRGLREHGL